MRAVTALVVILITLSALPAKAQDAAALRGGWFADVAGQRHILHLVAKSGNVTGIYCTDCLDPSKLSVVDDMQFTAAGLRFTLYGGGKSKQRTQVLGQLQGERLVLRRGTAQAAPWLVLERANRLAVPSVAPRPNAPAPAARIAYIAPAPAQTLQPASIAGLWLAGSGPNKQYFHFLPFRNGLRGMVCGPCDNPNNMAVLDSIRIADRDLFFDIVHEDNGLAFAQHGPHRNVTRAQLAHNEMHLWVIPDYEAADFPPIEMTLLGPIRLSP